MMGMGGGKEEDGYYGVVLCVVFKCKVRKFGLRLECSNFGNQIVSIEILDSLVICYDDRSFDVKLAICACTGSFSQVRNFSAASKISYPCEYLIQLYAQALKSPDALVIVLSYHRRFNVIVESPPLVPSRLKVSDISSRHLFLKSRRNHNHGTMFQAQLCARPCIMIKALVVGQ